MTSWWSQAHSPDGSPDVVAVLAAARGQGRPTGHLRPA